VKCAERSAKTPTRQTEPWSKSRDPRDIAKIEEEARSIAITYPTEENVAEWKRLTKYIYEKAFGFTAAQAAVTRTDTELVQQGCGYCTKQMPILDMFRRKTGMHYRVVDMHRLPAVVAKLGVSRTPDIFLVLKKEGRAHWQRIASGLNTEKELEDAVVFGLYALREIESMEDYR